MSQKIHDWIAAQIEASAPGKTDVNAIVRLARAAAALQGRPNEPAFGLTPNPAQIPDVEGLIQRCLKMIQQWVLQISAAERNEVASLLERLELPPVAGAYIEPRASHVLIAFLKASLDDFEAETEEEAQITDPRVLARLHGVRAVSDDVNVAEVFCIQNAMPKGVLTGSLELEFDAAASGLLCRLTLEVARKPTATEEAALLKAIGEELFLTGWGSHLEWALQDIDIPKTTTPNVESTLVKHQLEPVVSR